jgi:uncharacterized cofD-like protein
MEMDLRKFYHKIVAIGGGTGLPIVLKALKPHFPQLTAIVAVTDTGRNSGVLREEFNIPSPGDLRNCLLALAEGEASLLKLFGYRFVESPLKGYSLGNLFIVALTSITGNFKEAIGEVSRLLKVRGQVIPVTSQPIHICAELIDGTILDEERRIVQLNEEEKKAIRRVYTNPSNTRPTGEAVEAIRNADMVVIGPGSLYTSIISNLLIDGIAEAIRKTKAKVLYICNIMTQASQTHGYKASDHVDRIHQYLGEERLDYIVVNDGIPSNTLLERYEKDAHLVEVDEKIFSYKAEVIKADLVDEEYKGEEWQKKSWLRHHPEKLREVFIQIIGKERDGQSED